MMSSRTSFLVWWGLPILCAGLGGGVAAFLGQGGLFGSGEGQIGPLLLLGGYFAAVGLVALFLRMRQNQAMVQDRERFDKPVEAALIALCAPILVLGIGVFAKGFADNFSPSYTVAGKLMRIDRIGAFGRSYGVSLEGSPRTVIMKCRLQTNCGSPTPLLGLHAGDAIELKIRSGEALGLTANGRVLVNPAVQGWTRLLLSQALLAAAAIYTLLFASVSTRLLSTPDESDRGSRR